MLAPQPSSLWVVLDENPDSVNDAAFAVRMDPPWPATLWQDGVATYHGGGCGFAFADGHSEIHRWVNSDTMPPLATDLTRKASPNNRDVFWMQEHSTRNATTQ